MSSIPTRLIAIRHGEPEPRSHGRCYGRHDFALSDRGKEQARTLARALAGEPVAAVYTSPAIRARETALPIAAAHTLDPITIDGFAELDFGRFEGRTYDEIATNDPELYQQWMERPAEVHFPEGESYSDLRTRVLDNLGQLIHRHEAATFVIVAHGGVTRTILAHALAMPPSALFRVDQDYGCLNIIDWFDTEPVTRSVNQVTLTVPPGSSALRPERAR